MTLFSICETQVRKLQLGLLFKDSGMVLGEGVKECSERSQLVNEPSIYVFSNKLASDTSPDSMKSCDSQSPSGELEPSSGVDTT